MRKNGLAPTRWFSRSGLARKQRDLFPEEKQDRSSLQAGVSQAGNALPKKVLFDVTSAYRTGRGVSIWRWLIDLRAEPDILRTAVHMTRRLLRILREE
jgi:hypothetical protein